MKKIFCCVFCMLFMLTSSAFAMPEILDQIFNKKKEPAEEAVPGGAVKPREGSNIEEVLATLDEALKENRKLRQQITAMEEDLKKVPLESNVLKSQIRTLQHDLEEAKQRSQSDRQVLTVRQEEIKKKDELLTQHAAELEEIKIRSQSRTEKLREDVEKFRGLLKSSILTEERDEYRGLIQRAEEQSNRAVKELSDMTNSYKSMEHQLGLAYYDLGNKYFESKNYRNALAQYEKAITLNPDDPWAHHNLGVIYDYYAQNKQAALFHYEKYLQIKSADEDAADIRERVLELKLGSMAIPHEPLTPNFKKNTRTVELRETKARRWT